MADFNSDDDLLSQVMSKGNALGLSRRKKKKQSSLSTFEPGEPESILKTLAAGTMSGIQYVGETLDKPRRALFGAIAGKPEELLNLIPFSDTMGLTDPNNTVYGRDLLEQYAGAPKNREGFRPIDDFEDAAWDTLGLIADIAGDPFRFGTVGKLTAKGVAAGKAAGSSRVLGTSPFAMVKEIANKERSLASLRIPFTKSHLDLTGKGAASVAEKIAYSPPSRMIRQAFTLNPELKQYSKRGQMLADAKYSRILNAQASVVSQAIGFDQRSEEIVEVFGNRVKQMFDNHPELGKGLFSDTVDAKQLDINQIIRGLAEVKDRTVAAPLLSQVTRFKNLEDGINGMHSDLIQKFQTAAHGNHSLPDAQRLAAQALTGTDDMADTIAMTQKMDKYVHDMIEFKNETFKELQARGYKIHELEDDLTAHAPRSMEKVFQQVFSRYKSSTSSFDNAIKRKDVLKNIPGGTLAINQMSKDVAITGVKDAAVKNYVQRGMSIPDAIKQATKDLKATQPARLQKIMTDYIPTQAPTPDQLEHLTNVMEYFGDLPHEITSTGMFTGNVLHDMLDYVKRGQRVVAGLDAVYDVAAHTASTAKVGISVEDFFHALDGTHARHGFSTPTGLGFFDKTWQGIHGTAYTPNTHYVPEEFVDVAKRFMTFHSDNKDTIQMLKIWDKGTSMLKGGLTTPFPAFHTRNALGGLWQNLVTNDVKHFPQAMKNVVKAMMNNDRELVRLAEFHGIMPEGGSLVAQVAGGATDAGFNMGQAARQQLPDVPFKRLVENYKEGGIRGKNGIFGEGGALSMKNAEGSGVVSGLGKYGQDTMRTVETFNRLLHFEMKRLAGWTDSMAAHSTILNHFDYSTIGRSSKLQQGLKRIVPFYGWLRNNTPKQFFDLAQSPGGKQAQTVRTLAALQREAQNDAFLPDYLKEKVTIDNPFGSAEKKDGARSYLTMSGFLPIEDALNKFPTAQGVPDAKRTMQKALSMLHPVLQLPLEWSSGKQLWSGRPLSELHESPTGSSPLNEIIHKSPLARLATTVRQMKDPRKNKVEKAINLTIGGIGTTDVDYNKALEYEGRRLLEELLGKVPEAREFSRLSIPPEKFDALTPEQKKQYSLYSYLLKIGQKRSAAAKKEKAKKK